MNRDRDKDYSTQRYQDEPRLIKQNDDISTDVINIEETNLLPRLKEWLMTTEGSFFKSFKMQYHY